jgi:hypothetical protein
MAVQTFLIRCHLTYGARRVKALIDQVREWGGQVLLVTEKGQSLIVHLDDRFRDEIRARPEVALIGGVQIQQRRIRRIRVDKSRNYLATDVIIQGENHG